MTVSQQLCIKSAKEVAKFDQALSFRDFSIDKHFQARYKQLLQSPQRGGGKGFWLWKPYIVEQAIRALPDGDTLVYCDSGVEWIAPFSHLLRRMDNFSDGPKSESSIFLFSNGHRHIDWCKVEIISKMFGVPAKWDYAGQGFQHYKQVQASVIIMRVNEYTREFCSRWLAWSCIPGFINDAFNPAIQLPEFREHRNDQSILTNLAIEDGINLHHWPAQYWQDKKVDFPGDSYPQMFYHHRYRNIDWVKYAAGNGFGQPIDMYPVINHFMKNNKHV
jgi:hypothetical protein